MAALAGFHIGDGARILDFGCGDGAEVYRWRDCGFDAYGFDLHDTACLRSQDDAAFFRTGSAASADKADTRIEAGDYRIGYDDDFFDFVFSMTVFEHVTDLETTFAELSRVMKPASLGIHVFPASYAPVEPHLGVPLASFIQQPWWFHLWAAAGIRNEFQKDYTWRHTASENLRYARQGLRYVRPSHLTQVAGRHFREVTFAPHWWEYPSRRSNWLFASRAAQKISTYTRDVVLITARY